MFYGVEIWGWAERKELESIQGNYYRWTLRLDYNTPRYIVRKEAKVSKMKNKWGIRTLKFEEKIRKLEDDRLVKMCWKKKTRNKRNGAV